MRSSVVEVDAPFFNKDPWTVSFGNGTARIVYKPSRSRGRSSRPGCWSA